MNIGIDIDDTIAETYETLLPYAQKYTIEDLKRKSNINLKEDISSHFYIVNINGWNEQEALDFWSKYYGEILRNVNIKTFASDVIKKLKQEGHKIYLITARWDMPNDNIAQITKNWLEEKNVEYDELIINAADKLELAKEKNIDVFIDDSFKNCMAIADNTNAKVYIMNSKSNGKLDNEKIERVYSWPQVYSLLNNKEEN